MFRLAATLFAVVAFLSGLAGRMVEAVRYRDGLHLAVGSGDGWWISNQRGETDLASRVGRRLFVRPSQFLHVEARGDALREVRFDGRHADPAGHLSLLVQDRAGAGLRIGLNSNENVEAHVFERRPDGVELHRETVRLQGFLPPDSPRAFTLGFAEGELQLRIDDKPVVSSPLAVAASRLSIEVLGSPFGLTALRAAWTSGSVREADLVALPKPPARGFVLRGIAPYLAIQAGAVLLLAALCLGRPGWRRLVRAEILAAAPYNLGQGIAAFAGAPALHVAVLAIAPFGLLIGLFALRGHVRASGHPLRVRPVVVAALLAFAAARAAWHNVHDETEQRLVAERGAVWIEDVPEVAGTLPHGSWTLPQPAALHVGNLLEPPGQYRDFDLHAEVEVEAGAALELRMRSDGSAAAGVALFLSSDPGLATALVEEDLGTFRTVSGPGPQLVPGRACRVEVHARGRRFEAVIDGQRIAGESARFHRGALRLLAAGGVARVASLSAQARAARIEDVPDGRGRKRLALAAPLALLLVFAAAASMACRTPWLRALEGSAFALVPFTYVVLAFTPDGALPPVTFAWTAFAITVLLLLHPMVHARGLTFPRFAGLVVLAGAGGVATLRAATLPPELPEDPRQRHEVLNAMSYADQGGALHADWIHLQHPLIRRFNGYCADHVFRDRRVEPDKPSGRLRVVCLGSSSTYGYLLPEGSGQDYPAQLEAGLRASLGADVEVVNAAWSGATAARIYWFLRNVAVDLAPDVVTLSVYYNDAVVLSQGDEGAWFERWTRSGAAPGALDLLRARMEVQRERACLERLIGTFTGSDTATQWRGLAGDGSDPAGRFERTLHRFADLAEERGFELVLVKEAVKGDRARIWKDEFRAAMDRVATQRGLLLADPTATLKSVEALAKKPLFMDEVHLYPLGCKAMAHVLQPVVEEALRRSQEP